MRHFLRVKIKEREIKTLGKKETVISVYPSYVARSKDLMRKGGKFYAVYDPEIKMWSTDESSLVHIIDDELYSYREKIAKEDGFGNWRTDNGTRVLVDALDDSETKQLKELNLWMSNLSPNHAFTPLDTEITFKDDEVAPEDYRSKRLSYNVAPGDLSAYDLLMSTLYSPENRQKIEWAVGSVFAGESKNIEKLLVLYGKKGTGKSTIIDLIKMLFEGYWAPFIASELVSKSKQFGTAAFKDNPLVAIQDDGTLEKIETPVLNEIVSHKEILINEKGKQQYMIRPNSLLFLATNDLVDIHDTNLGITRRLLDVYPTGNKISPVKEYRRVKAQLKFELGAIADHCLKVYKEMGMDYYEGYIPEEMIKKTNYLKNFMFDMLDVLEKDETVTRDSLYRMYVDYFEQSGLGYPPKRLAFGEQLKEYYYEYYDSKWLNGRTVRHVYSGLRVNKILGFSEKAQNEKETETWLKFINNTKRIFENACCDCPAQYASSEGKPMLPWSKVTTKLSDIDVNELHYVRVPKNHIVIDFDLKDENGEKSLEKNIEAASKWKPTYAELSKSGKGIHLHYIYDGDVDNLARVYDDDIEIKVFSGRSSLRRKFTKSVALAIAVIASGLPLKGGKEVVDNDIVKNEKAIRTIIMDCLNKKHHGSTAPEVHFIYDILERAYESGNPYDVTDLRQSVLIFAAHSTNQASACLKMVNKMRFKSEEPRENKEADDAPIIFYDVEVFPNLFVLCWKVQGENKPAVKLINPLPSVIENLTKFRLVGFNNRRYDNHILYARMLGYTEEQLYGLSQKIISGSKNAFFGEAYNLSYTDIYDFCSKKQSLKKWEIELGIHHQELGLPWDKPVSKEMYEKVADYCLNDVMATEAVFNARYEDFVAREILADISGLTVNDTTNQHTARIIFGDAKHPQSDFVYTDLSEMFPGYTYDPYEKDKDKRSKYRDEYPKEGGYVYAEPGMYGNVALLDVASMHPTSIECLNLFGPYTENFSRLKKARLAIKREDYILAGEMFDGKLKKYLTSEEQADSLSYALKIAINSVYGLTSANFENKFRDPRNIDNIVAKRGALFMVDLKHAVQEKGFTVAHIKTDSIKIPDATPEIISFVMEFGKKYGYEFEHEATYDKMCLVNDAVYIARYKDGKKAGQWTATGAQFAQPYVFKTLFSKEPILFEDKCETRTVSTALYLDMNEGLPEEEHKYCFVGKAGQFCPIKSGCGGGILLREKDGAYNSAPNAKGYRWLESEVVKKLNKENDIDISFYTRLVDSAVEDISKYGDFEWFVSEDKYHGELAKLPEFMNVPEGSDEDLPF